MKFTTNQAQEAYAELLGEVGRQSVEMLSKAKEMADKMPQDSLQITMTAMKTVADMQIDGHERAIRLGANIDMQWASLKGHLMMCGNGEA